jgi:hypothetical protein
MKSLSCLALLISLLFISGAFVQAQDRYVVSARAGVVNFVTGQASVSRVGGTRSSLLRQDTIEVGDTASTADGAYAEVLLNPGSYLRLAPNSRFRFGSTSLEDTSIELLAGSAILEINADNAFALSVTTPGATLRFDRSGIYRVDIEPAPGQLEVVKGSALVGSTEVKAGRFLRFEAGATPEKFDPKALDAFGVWSESRAQELARITNAVQTQALNNALASSYYSNMWEFLPSRPGLWIWDRSFGCGFFLPFGGRHHSHWSYGYYGGNPFDWNRYGWKDRREHPRDTTAAPSKTTAFAGNKDHHPKPVVGPDGTDHTSGTDHHREPRSDKSSKDAKPRTNDRGWTRGGSDSTHSRGSGSNSGGSQNGGGDNSHHTWTRGSGSGGGSSGGSTSGGSNNGTSGSRGGGSGTSGSSGSGGSRGGGSSSGGGGGGSHSSGGSSSGGSGGSSGSHSSGGSSGGSPSSKGGESSPKTIKDI